MTVKLGISKQTITVSPIFGKNVIYNKTKTIAYIKETVKRFGLGNVYIQIDSNKKDEGNFFDKMNSHFINIFNHPMHVLSFAIHINDFNLLKWLCHFDKENISSYVDGDHDVDPLSKSLAYDNINMFKYLIQFSEGKCIYAFENAIRKEYLENVEVMDLFIQSGVSNCYKHGEDNIPKIRPLQTMLLLADFNLSKQFIEKINYSFNSLLWNYNKKRCLSSELVGKKVDSESLPDYMTIVEYLDFVQGESYYGRDKKFTLEEYQELRQLLLSKGAQERYEGWVKYKFWESYFYNSSLFNCELAKASRWKIYLQQNALAFCIFWMPLFLF